jgi:hypothetical protein
MNGPLLIVQIAAVVVYFLGIGWTGSFFSSYSGTKKVSKMVIALIFGIGVFFLIGAGLSGIVFIFVAVLLFLGTLEADYLAGRVPADSLTNSEEDVLRDGFE